MDSLLRQTTAGRVRGIHFSDCLTWRGVPFAEAPSGTLRWAAPRPVQPWGGVRNCGEYGQIASQPSNSVTSKTVGGEDCLHLDIARPVTDETLPVVVYFHGGSFIFGSSHDVQLRGHNFCRQLNVVYVSVNFRLGVLGYVDTTPLAQGSDDDVPAVANPAVLDQIAALRWVRENIAQFGGDPNNVSIMGESAGGAAVVTLMASPAAHGLFHKAVVQSAPAASVHTPDQAEYWLADCLAQVGLSDDTTLTELRRMPAEWLTAVSNKMVLDSKAMISLNTCFAPVVDGDVLPEHPLAAFQAGRQALVPLIVGTNRDETSYQKFIYPTAAARLVAARRTLNNYDPVHTNEVLEGYPKVVTRDGYARFLGDAVFWGPSMQVAEFHTKRAPTWVYRFDYTPRALRMLKLGAVHALELSALFGGDDRRTKLFTALGGSADLVIVTMQMQRQWANFFHEDVPRSDWLPFEDGHRATMIFDVDSELQIDPRRAQRQAWANFDMTQFAGQL